MSTMNLSLVRLTLSLPVGLAGCSPAQPDDAENQQPKRRDRQQ